MFTTSRRRVLAGGMAGAALLAGGGLLSWLTRGYALVDGAPPPVALSVKELCVVTALVQALHPRDGAFPSGEELGVPARIDEELYSQPAAMRDDLKAAIQLLEHAPPLLGYPGKLTALGPAVRAEAFQRLLAEGPDVVVQAGVGLKQLMGLFIFGHASTWQAIGYDGPWQKEPQPPPSHQRYLDAVAAVAVGRRPA
jgi:hypothetical protein